MKDHRNDMLLTLGTLLSVILGYYGYYFFDGNILLTTNDAYHFATATKDLINGNLDNAFYPIASLEMPSILSAMFYYLLPFSIDDLFFFLPIILSSFVAIPMYLFAKDMTNKYYAFFAATLTPISIGYSNRTIGGYYDTDMLVLFFPLLGLYFMYRILKQYNLRDVIFAAICFILALLWHKVSATYILTTSVFLALFYILIKDRNNLKQYEALGILIIAISFINIYIKIIVLAILLHFMSDKVFVFQSITQKIASKIKYKSVLILFCYKVDITKGCRSLVRCTLLHPSVLLGRTAVLTGWDWSTGCRGQQSRQGRTGRTIGRVGFC